MKTTIFNIIMLTSLTSSGLVCAQDFSLKSDHDLYGIRDQIQTMDIETGEAYRAERQNRMSTMDQSKRNSIVAGMGASGKNNMDGKGQHSGSGGGKQKGKGSSGQSGNTHQNRYREDYGHESGSAKGQGSGGGKGQGSGSGGKGQGSGGGSGGGKGRVDHY